MNGGLCTDQDNDYVCACPLGYAGQDCELAACPADTASVTYADSGTCTCARTKITPATAAYSCVSGALVGSNCVTTSSYAASPGQRYCRVTNNSAPISNCDNTNAVSTTTVVPEGGQIIVSDGTALCREPVTAGANWFASTPAVCAARSPAGRSSWGYNGTGNLGLGHYTFATAPAAVTAVSPASGWTRVSAATENTTCGVNGGRIYCWGRNFEGSVGLGTGTSGADIAVPTEAFGGATNWTDVRMGWKHACGLRAGEP